MKFRSPPGDLAWLIGLYGIAGLILSGFGLAKGSGVQAAIGIVLGASCLGIFARLTFAKWVFICYWCIVVLFIGLSALNRELALNWKQPIYLGFGVYASWLLWRWDPKKE